MPLDTGEILEGRYRIDALLGQGGMGAVYRAIDLKFNTLVAIKENRQFAPEGQRQFAREAGLLHQLRHPNLPRVTDHFFLPGRGQYLVMDYVEGDDLEQILARQGCLAQAQALGIIDRVLDALTYLHCQDIVHRDVKPANTKITPGGKVFLVDFGLAKAQAALQSTTAGARGVTPGYAPPEQYGYGRTDARTDVYSAGATLYALLTGQKPPDALERMMRQVELVPVLAEKSRPPEEQRVSTNNPFG
jgi:serine/threonine protein kinase